MTHSSPATKLIRLQWKESQELRTTKQIAYAHDLDYFHERLQEKAVAAEKEKDVAAKARAVQAGAIIAVHGLTGKRMSTMHENRTHEGATRAMQEFLEQMAPTGPGLSEVHVMEGLRWEHIAMSPFYDARGEQRFEMRIEYDHWKGMQLGNFRRRVASLTPAPEGIPIEKDNTAVFVRYAFYLGVFEAQDPTESVADQVAEVFGSEAAHATHAEAVKQLRASQAGALTVSAPNENADRVLASMPKVRCQIAAEWLKRPVFPKISAAGEFMEKAMKIGRASCRERV